MTIEELENVLHEHEEIHIREGMAGTYWFIRIGDEREVYTFGDLESCLDRAAKGIAVDHVRSRIIEKLDAGTLTQSDPDYVSYMALIKERQAANDSP